MPTCKSTLLQRLMRFSERRGSFMPTCGSGLARESGSRFAACLDPGVSLADQRLPRPVAGQYDGKVSARGIASGPKALAYC